MTTTYVSTWSTLKTAVSTASSGDTIELTTNISTAVSDNTVLDITGLTIDGNGRSIILHSTRTVGLFELSNSTVIRLVVDASTATLSNNNAVMMYYNSGNLAQYGTFSKCSVIGATIGENGGAYTSFKATTSVNKIYINNCNALNLTLSRYAGGLCGGETENVEITNSYATISAVTSENGGLIGNNIKGGNSITNSYVILGVNMGSGSGGLIGRGFGSGIISINRCSIYITNGFSGTFNGALIGGTGTTSSAPTDLTVNITDCYVSGNITGSSSSSFIGYVAYGTITINVTRCYHGNSNSGRGLVGFYGTTESGSRAINVTDCVVSTTTLYNTFPQGNILRIDTSTEGMDQRLPDGTDQGQTNFNGYATNFSTSTWTAGTGSGLFPTLNNFATSPWDGTYTEYNDQPEFAQGQGGGDPHILTLSGKYYDYNVMGYSRYINSNNMDFVINCRIDEGEGIWKKKSYIRNLYIFYKGSYIYVNTGFRSEKVKIIEQYLNPEDNIVIKENELQFDKKGKNLCFKCCKNKNDCEDNEKCDGDFRKMYRNQISIDLNSEYKIVLYNVNKYNYNPCQILLSIKDKLIDDYQGLLVDGIWANSSKISNHLDCSPLIMEYTKNVKSLYYDLDNTKLYNNFV